MPNKTPSPDKLYERIFDSALEDKHLSEAVGACGMTMFSLFMRYVDTAPQGETLNEWLVLEFPLPRETRQDTTIPDYDNPADIIALAGEQPADGLMPLADLMIMHSLEAVEVDQPASVQPLAQ